MVDVYGRWTYYADTREDKKCVLDKIADMIVADGYIPKTTIEYLAEMIFDCYETELKYSETDYYAIKPANRYDFNIKDIMVYLYENGGYQEFDYYA